MAAMVTDEVTTGTMVPRELLSSRLVFLQSAAPRSLTGVRLLFQATLLTRLGFAFAAVSFDLAEIFKREAFGFRFALNGYL